MFQVKTFIFRWNLQFNYFSQTAFHFYSFLLSLSLFRSSIHEVGTRGQNGEVKGKRLTMDCQDPANNS